VSAEEMTSTGCSAQGALRPKRQRPNEHSAMSAKPATRNADSMAATHQVAPGAHAGTANVLANVPAGDHKQEPHAGAHALAAQPILLRLPMVIRITGLARSTIYKLISQNQFPVPIKLSKRAVAWLQSEIESWVSSRMRTH